MAEGLMRLAPVRFRRVQGWWQSMITPVLRDSRQTEVRQPLETHCSNGRFIPSRPHAPSLFAVEQITMSEKKENNSID
jgi:hypothetical protein